MALEFPQDFPTIHVPYLYRPIVAGTDEPPTSGVKRECTHKRLVTRERLYALSSLRVPNFYLAIIRS